MQRKIEWRDGRTVSISLPLDVAIVGPSHSERLQEIYRYLGKAYLGTCKRRYAASMLDASSISALRHGGTKHGSKGREIACRTLPTLLYFNIYLTK